MSAVAGRVGVSRLVYPLITNGAIGVQVSALLRSLNGTRLSLSFT